MIVITCAIVCFIYYLLNRWLETKTQAWRRPAAQT